MNQLNLFNLNIMIFKFIILNLWTPQLPKLPSKHLTVLILKLNNRDTRKRSRMSFGYLFC